MSSDFTVWLISPGGVEFTHAVILLITACTAYISYLARRQARRNQELLNSHIEQHVLDATERGTATGERG